MAFEASRAGTPRERNVAELLRKVERRACESTSPLSYLRSLSPPLSLSHIPSFSHTRYQRGYWPSLCSREKPVSTPFHRNIIFVGEERFDRCDVNRPIRYFLLSIYSRVVSSARRRPRDLPFSARNQARRIRREEEKKRREEEEEEVTSLSLCISRVARDSRDEIN